MPRFIYTAKTHPQKTIQGDIEAESQQDAINKLSKMGYFPVSVAMEGSQPGRDGILNFRKVSANDIVLFTRQLSTLVESGVNILNGLNIVSTQLPNKYLKAILNDVISRVKDGKALSDALSAHPQLFSGLYVSIIRSGEASGNMDATLRRLADFLEDETELRNSVGAALIYPAFVFIVSALTVAVLLGFVIPRLVAMFTDMGQALPLPTRILINVSTFLRAYWWFILALILTAVFLLRRLHQRPRGKILLDGLSLRLPLLGEITLKTETGRLMRTLSVLLSSGMPIVYSMDVAISVIGNQILITEMQKFKEQIASGMSFSGCLKNSKLFPDFVTNIVTIGEETGALDKSLMRIADTYEKDVDRYMKALTRLLEPTIILVMGLIVGFIVISMLLPIFQINLIVR